VHPLPDGPASAPPRRSISERYCTRTPSELISRWNESSQSSQARRQTEAAKSDMRGGGVGMPQTHLGRDVALESDEEEADAVEQVLVADVVVRAGRGHGSEPKGG